jgi:hypothetical protein
MESWALSQKLPSRCSHNGSRLAQKGMHMMHPTASRRTVLSRSILSRVVPFRVALSRGVPFRIVAGLILSLTTLMISCNSMAPPMTDPMDDSTADPMTDPTSDPMSEPMADDATIVLGVANGEPFRELNDGDDMQLFSLGQGGTHMFLSYRVTGFEPDADVQITISAVRAEDGMQAIREFTQTDQLTDLEPGVSERLDRLVRIDALFPSEVVEREVTVTVTVVSDDGETSATATRTWRLLQPT